MKTANDGEVWREGSPISHLGPGRGHSICNETAVAIVDISALAERLHLRSRSRQIVAANVVDGTHLEVLALDVVLYNSTTNTVGLELHDPCTAFGYIRVRTSGILHECTGTVLR